MINIIIITITLLLLLLLLIIIIMSFQLILICVRCTRIRAGRMKTSLFLNSVLVFTNMCAYNGSPGMHRDYLCACMPWLLIACLDRAWFATASFFKPAGPRIGAHWRGLHPLWHGHARSLNRDNRGKVAQEINNKNVVKFSARFEPHFCH